MEIERKFLVKLENAEFNLEDFKNKKLLQSYISVDPTIRLRQEGDEYILCVKSKGDESGLMRQEFELPLTSEQFESLWEKRETKSVLKTRYYLPLDGGLVAELDIYYGELSGLKTVEVEFETKEQAESFVPPKWFGADVTADVRYKNSSLALGDVDVNELLKME